MSFFTLILLTNPRSRMLRKILSALSLAEPALRQVLAFDTKYVPASTWASCSRSGGRRSLCVAGRLGREGKLVALESTLGLAHLPFLGLDLDT